MTSATVVVHHIHDPRCGWCYGAAPLVRVARTLLPVPPEPTLACGLDGCAPAAQGVA